MKQAKSPARFSKTPLADPEPSVDLGEHTVEILSELGLSLVEMQDLARQGVLCSFSLDCSKQKGPRYESYPIFGVTGYHWVGCCC